MTDKRGESKCAQSSSFNPLSCLRHFRQCRSRSLAVGMVEDCLAREYTESSRERSPTSCWPLDCCKEFTRAVMKSLECSVISPFITEQSSCAFSLDLQMRLVSR